MTILLVDDHKIIRDGLTQILKAQFPSALIEESGDAEAVLPLLHQKPFDVVICDLSMPGRSGLDVVKQIKEAFPQLPVLVLSMLPEDQYAVRALKAGAAGFISKANGGLEVVEAIRRVQLGRRYISPRVSELLAESLLNDSDAPHRELSDRELHVFTLLAQGVSITDIADRLSLSLSTVSTHRSRILRKLNMKSNADLTRYALEQNLI